jgi:small subunit ribosomal protein S18
VPIRDHSGARFVAQRVAAGRVPREPKKKVCPFCKDKGQLIDYKDTGLLRRFLSDRGKIRSRQISGTCRQHQREVALAVKNAREVALLPYAATAGAGGGERRRI